MSTSNFISIDPQEARSPRLPDGSLPKIKFMHLTSTSSLIDAGTIVNGITFTGDKPDLGCFENDGNTLISTLHKPTHNHTYPIYFHNNNLLIILNRANIPSSPLSIKIFTLKGALIGEYCNSVKMTNCKGLSLPLKSFSCGCYVGIKGGKMEN